MTSPQPPHQTPPHDLPPDPLQAPLPAPTASSPWAVLWVFLRLGLTSFGGPVAHLGYFRDELVVRRRWLDEHSYADLVALCQFLPGPASSQVGMALGLMRSGWLGALAAWVGFTLPSALVLAALGLGFSSGGAGLPAGLVQGLKVVAVAVVAQAVWGMARTLTPDLRRMLIGVAAAMIALLMPGSLGQITAIGLGIVAGLLVCRIEHAGIEEDRAQPSPVSTRAAIICLGALVALLILLPLLAASIPSSLLGTADAFTRAGALVFGGGHVVLPLLQAEPVIAGAVTPDQFLAGYGAAQAMPGPLFTFAAYLGAVAQPGGGPVTAAVALVSVFLPGMLLLLGVWPFWSRIRSAGPARGAIRGANAAVVGVLAATLAHPLISTGITGPVSVGIAVVCLALLALRVPPWISVVLGAIVGGVAALLGFGLAWG